MAIDTKTQDYHYEPKGASRGGEGGNFAPLPEDKFQMIIEEVRVKPPQGDPKIVDGKPQRQYEKVLFTCALVAPAAEKLKKRTAKSLEDGQEQSTIAWASFNYTWGWFDQKTNSFKTTKLFDFVADAAGFKTKKFLKAWINHEQGVIDPAWAKGLEFRGFIEHTARPQGGVWVNVSPQALDSAEDENYTIITAHANEYNPKLFKIVLEEIGDDDDASDGATNPGVEEDDLPY